MLHNDIVKEDIGNEIQRLLTDNEISKDKTLKMLKKAENVAKTSKDYLEIFDRMSALTGITGKKEVKTTVTQEIDYSKMLKGEQPIRKIKQEITSNNIDIIDNYEVNGVIGDSSALETKEEGG